ncbi:MAG TPA: HD domain-containing protein [Oculatellaceae cyanobacterium]
MPTQIEKESFALPNTKHAAAVNEFLRSEASPHLYNHSVRSFLFASEFATAKKCTYDREVLFFGCMLHDLGLIEKYYGTTRFEVDGANAASKKLQELGVDEKTRLVVWDAVALHATTHIPQQKQPEIALVQLGAAADVMGLNVQDLNHERLRAILSLYPRENMKERILDDLIAYLRQNPAGGAGYWMDKIADKHVKHGVQFDLERAIKAAPFEE